VARYEVKPELIERFRKAAERGQGVRLDKAATYALARMLERVVDLRDKPKGLDREADVAVYFLTGEFPSLDKYQATDVDAPTGETPDSR
jgi:hypothetical protein